jgi:Methyltransferase domain
VGDRGRLGGSFQRASLRNTQITFSNTGRFGIGVGPPLFVWTAHESHKIHPAGTFDAVLIDGDHSYAGCYRDLVTCDTLVKPCGVRIAHDWASVPGTHVGGKRGVQKAVRVFSRRRGYSASPGAGIARFPNEEAACGMQTSLRFRGRSLQ